jgi:hypothetical protein
MAKLSANGQKERLRLVLERDCPGSGLISWEKDQVRALHSYGWKQATSALLKKDPAAYEAALRYDGYVEVAAKR